jgi:hypothetical protein
MAPCGPEIELVTARAGATLASEPLAADRLSVLLSGSATYGAETIDGITLVHVPAGATSAAVVAREECTVLIVTFG